MENGSARQLFNSGGIAFKEKFLPTLKAIPRYDLD
jgi:hypothetical protein